LVQVADVFAFVFRRFSAVTDYGDTEGYDGELERLSGWINTLGGRLLSRSHRCPKKPKSEAAEAYVELIPTSLRELG